MSGSIAAGYIGMAIFLYLTSMYFQLWYIRNGKQRILKKKLVLVVRKEMKWHARTGWLGLGLILLHICMMLDRFMYSFVSMKLLSGIVAFLFLSLTLWTGWLRSKKANGRRRKWHIVTSMTFTLAFLVHIFWF